MNFDCGSVRKKCEYATSSYHSYYEVGSDVAASMNGLEVLYKDNMFPKSENNMCRNQFLWLCCSRPQISSVLACTSMQFGHAHSRCQELPRRLRLNRALSEIHVSAESLVNLLNSGGHGGPHMCNVHSWSRLFRPSSWSAERCASILVLRAHLRSCNRCTFTVLGWDTRNCRFTQGLLKVQTHVM